MLKKYQRTLIKLLCLAAVIVLLLLLNQGSQSFHEKYEDADLTTDVTGIGRENTYDGYLLAHADAPQSTHSVAVDLSVFEGEGELRTDEAGVPCVFAGDNSSVTFTVDVPEAGMYSLLLDYMAVASRGVDIERELYINGELPFSGAATLCFPRLWTDDGEVRKDNQGNDIRPSQIEVFSWQQMYCQDDMGYTVEPYLFYFNQGVNTITLKAVNEPMLLRSLTLMPAMKTQDYAAYAASHGEIAMSESAKSWQSVIQGEDAYLRSTPSLYARYDRSSPATEPYSVTNTVLNYIGGDPWNKAGQWIEWELEVPEDGLYTISIKARQSYQRGAVSFRSLYIDGEIPFEEVSKLGFDYSTSWEMLTLSDENGNPYRFHLTAGKHTIRLQAMLGDMGPILHQLEDSIYRLNLIYRKLLVLTGVNPDRFRDYNLAGLYPEAIEAMDLESKRLYKLVDDVVDITGQKSDRAAVAQTLAVQLENFVNYNERITQQFVNFKDNITSLGTAMQNMSETKLDVDLIIVSGENAKLPKVNDGPIEKAIHEI